MNDKTIKITPAQSNQRIDKFLAGFCAEKSRASWQKRIRNKEVLVNDKEIKPDYVLKEGNKLVISNGCEKSRINNEISHKKHVRNDRSFVLQMF